MLVPGAPFSTGALIGTGWSIYSGVFGADIDGDDLADLRVKRRETHDRTDVRTAGVLSAAVYTRCVRITAASLLPAHRPRGPCPPQALVRFLWGHR
jgi:hypothetical protein